MANCNPSPVTRFKKGHAPLGPQPLSVNWKEFDALCAIQCTLAEIALVLGTTQETITLAVRRQWGMAFKEYYEQKRKVGFISLRRKQYELAMSGDKTMLIWLGKNLLGQADRQEVTGRNGGPIEYVRTDLGKLSDEELRQLEQLVEKAHREGNETSQP